MATVVIIHAADDTLPARALAEKLRGAKLQVILERPPGEQLREGVKSSAVTIALWSPRSVSQPDLIDEVAFAKGKSKVVHALMQSAAAPEQFRGEQAVNLTGWRGEDDFKAWRELADIVTKKAGVGALPPPAPRPPSGFFQPGRPEDGPPSAGQQQRQASPRQPQQQQQQRAAPPQPRPQPAQQPQRQAAAPRPAPMAPPPEPKGGGNGMLIGIIALVVIALAAGGGYWYFTQNQSAQTTSLEDVDLSSATAIREFLSGDPPAAQREQAQEALETLERQTFDAARDANTIEAFEAFLRDFPDSDEAIFVQGQIQQLRLLEADPAAQGLPPAEAAPPAEESAVPPGEITPVDPDLVPPNSAPGAGPAVIAPPAQPAQDPGAAPSN